MPTQLVMYGDPYHPDSRALDDRLVAIMTERGKVGSAVGAGSGAACGASERHYAKLGLSLEYCGIEDEFDAAQLDARWACDAIHLSGGNTLRFLYWLRKLELEHALRETA